jgi:hypothetical protein
MSARIIPLHRGIRLPLLEARQEDCTPPPAANIVPPVDYDTRPQSPPDLYRSLCDIDIAGDDPMLGESMVEFFRHRGDLIVGLIAGTGFGCLLTAALALFIGGGGR